MSLESYSKKSLRQFLSYSLIGALTNIFGYALYLFLTHLWGSPKLTMTLLYSMGTLMGFLANRRFTFQHNGHVGVVGARYLLAQLIGYLLNFMLLFVFVDLLGFSHRIVQAIAIMVVAGFLFVLLKVFVFHQRITRTEAVKS